MVCSDICLWDTSKKNDDDKKYITIGCVHFFLSVVHNGDSAIYVISCVWVFCLFLNKFCDRRCGFFKNSIAKIGSSQSESDVCTSYHRTNGRDLFIQFILCKNRLNTHCERYIVVLTTEGKEKRERKKKNSTHFDFSVYAATIHTSQFVDCQKGHF